MLRNETCVCELGGTELEHRETEDHVLCLGRKGLLTLPVTISINLLLQQKPAVSSLEDKQRSSELPRMYHLPDGVKLCSYMIKALFSQTTIHLQTQMYAFALTHVYTCQVCVRVMGLSEHVVRWSLTSVLAIVLVAGSLVELRWLRGGGGGGGGLRSHHSCVDLTCEWFKPIRVSRQKEENYVQFK